MNTYYVKIYNGYHCIYDEVMMAASKNDVLRSLLAGQVLDTYTKIVIEE
ncbi:hypothetical protein [Bacillus sp. AG4(2022)]|nr:hypothetical protein [Bacillus sp. AG4(2022)]MDT0160369.1 hypothetical protein [Bacillus sp. AG4(2022)]